MSERLQPGANERATQKMDLAESLLDQAANPPKAEKLDIEVETSAEVKQSEEAAKVINGLARRYGLSENFFDYAEDGRDTMQIAVVDGREPKIVGRIIRDGQETPPFPIFTLNSYGREVRTNEGGNMTPMSMTAQDIERWSEYFDMQKVLLRGIGKEVEAKVYESRMELMAKEKAKPEEVAELQEMSRLISDRFPDALQFSKYSEDELDEVLERRRNLQAAKRQLEELGFDLEDTKSLKRMKSEIDERLAEVHKTEKGQTDLGQMEEDLAAVKDQFKETGERKERYRQMVIDNRVSPQEQREQREQKFL